MSEERRLMAGTDYYAVEETLELNVGFVAVPQELDFLKAHGGTRAAGRKMETQQRARQNEADTRPQLERLHPPTKLDWV